MDANYVMDETLGTTSFDITKLRVGQTKMETFSIGKVRLLIPSQSLAYSLQYTHAYVCVYSTDMWLLLIISGLLLT